jgi:hypothetical protein
VLELGCRSFASLTSSPTVARTDFPSCTPPDVLHLKATSKRDWWPFYTSPLFLNTVGIAFCLCHVGHLVTFCIITSDAYRKGVGIYAALDGNLAVAQAAWTGTLDPNLIDASLSSTADFIHQWRLFISYVALPSAA